MPNFFVCYEDLMGGVVIIFRADTRKACETFIAQRMLQPGRRVEHYVIYEKASKE